MGNTAAIADHLLTTFPIEVQRRIARRIVLAGDFEMRIAADLPIIPVYDRDGRLTDLWDAETLRPIPRKAYGPPKPWHIILHGIADKAMCSPVSRVYFIGGEGCAIKIGFSVDPQDRLRTIQAHSPVPLKILALRHGGPDREAAYHCQFEAHRLHGEWFSPHPDILAEIDRLNAPKSGPSGSPNMMES